MKSFLTFIFIGAILRAVMAQPPQPPMPGAAPGVAMAVVAKHFAAVKTVKPAARLRAAALTEVVALSIPPSYVTLTLSPAGNTYAVVSSPDLVNWSACTNPAATSASVAMSGPQMFYRARILTSTSILTFNECDWADGYNIYYCGGTNQVFALTAELGDTNCAAVTITNPPAELRFTVTAVDGAAQESGFSDIATNDLTPPIIAISQP